MTCGAGTTTYHSGARELTPYSRVHIYWSLLVFFADIDYFCPDFSFTYWIFIILFCIRSLFRLISTPMENIFIDERIKSIEYLLVIEEILWSYEVINNKLFKWQWIKLGGTNHLNNLNCMWYLKTHQFYYTFNIFNQLLLFLYPFFCPMV